MTFGQAWYLRRELGGKLEGRATLDAVTRILAASALLAAVATACTSRSTRSSAARCRARSSRSAAL